MKLFLTSYRIPDLAAYLSLFTKPASELRIAIIPNAGDYYADRARAVKLRDYINDYWRAVLGINPEAVDLRDYHHRTDALEVKLKTFDGIWVGGGNTFCLRHEMKASGFDSIIRSLLDHGIVYGGESAGACVAGISLKGLEGADNPEFSESIIWEGLSLVPYMMSPHSDNAMFADDTEIIRQLYKNDPSLKELTDNQALLINGSTERLIQGTYQG